MQLIAMFRFESRLLLRCLVFVGHRFGISSVLSMFFTWARMNGQPMGLKQDLFHEDVTFDLLFRTPNDLGFRPWWYLLNDEGRMDGFKLLFEVQTPLVLEVGSWNWFDFKKARCVTLHTVSYRSLQSSISLVVLHVDMHMYMHLHR